MWQSLTFRDRAGWKVSMPMAILMVLAVALIIATVAWASASGLQGAGDIARGMASHPIVRMPAQVRA